MFELGPGGGGSCPRCGRLVSAAAPPAPPDARSFSESTTPAGVLFRSRQSVVGSIVLTVLAVPLAVAAPILGLELGVWVGLLVATAPLMLGGFALGAASAGGDVLVGPDSVTVRTTPGR